MPRGAYIHLHMSYSKLKTERRKKKSKLGVKCRSKSNERRKTAKKTQIMRKAYNTISYEEVTERGVQENPKTQHTNMITRKT